MLPIQRVGPVVKLGEGELGGKARVLPFLDRVLSAANLSEGIAPHAITVPETWVLATDCFSEFVERNRLESAAELEHDDEIRRRFLAGRHSDEVFQSLERYLELHQHPLAVRSSALSEDTHYRTTAGLFSTLFIPNSGRARLRQLSDAIKLVYASAFFVDVGRYLREHSIPREDERMAVALETVVGTTRCGVHYPLVSGVAQSVNYFPVGQMSPEDGVATIVMGLGRRVVQGLDGLRFCPRYPLIRAADNAELARRSQRLIDAVDLSATDVQLSGTETETLRELEVEQTKAHKTLNLVGSVWEESSGMFYDSPIRPGPRILTFNRLLRESLVPLPTMLQRVLPVIDDGFGMPVEVEFALEIDSRAGQTRGSLVLLQARPLPTRRYEAKVEIPALSPEQIVLQTDRTLGHGSEDDIHDIVFVDPHVFSSDSSVQLADEVAALNEHLRAEKRPYLLLGPGRWGSSNRSVGVPVRFRQIDGARLIAEIGTDDLAIEPSQGTHFFHNVVSQSLFYLAVDTRIGHRLDLAWLRAQSNIGNGRLVKWIHSREAIGVRVDATKRQGVAFRQS